MTPERMRQIEELYHAARQRESGDRQAFLAAACAHDEELRHKVALLLAQDSIEGPLEQRALDVAATLLRGFPGEELGPYRILSRLGEGGMATVYEARDTRLGRIVALKVAHEEFSGRFQREARAISSLNHPHVCALYDAGPNYLVMERLEGQTLASRLAKGALPMPRVLEYGAQIADALAAAHAKGITHRDLKPGNIMLTKAGVKVLDFGLAKFVKGHDPGARQDDSVTDGQTIVGSPAYMAPEQLEGEDCDARTDHFALGLVLYEMATGTRAFQGTSRAALMAEILKSEPDCSKLSPPGFAHVVERCLEKDREKRWQSARDIQLELEFQARGIPETPVKTTRRTFLWATAAVTGAVALIAAIAVRPGPPDPYVTPFTTYPGHEAGPSFSPDGTRIAFTWNGPHEDNYDVYVKQIGPGDPQRLTFGPQADTHPRWSPDGKWIAFLRHLRSTPAAVWAVPATGGTERKVGNFDFDRAAMGTLDWSPDGKWLLITRRPAADRGTGLALLSFEGGEIRQITSPQDQQPDFLGAFAPDGHALAFLRMRVGRPRLMVLPLTRSLEPAGNPIEIQVPQPVTHVCWTADSRELIFAAGPSENSMLWRMAASGKSPAQPLSYAGNGLFPTISRQGNRMAFLRFSNESHIWSLELNSNGQPAGPPEKAFASTRADYAPRFSRDGNRVVFHSDRTGGFAIWVCESSGANCYSVSPPGAHATNPDWSPDGKWIAFNVQGESGNEIELVRSEVGRPTRLTRGPAGFEGAMFPRWSRDGQWIYFQCGMRPQICRVPSIGGEAEAVRGAAGFYADESPDGKWLYFSRGIAAPWQAEQFLVTTRDTDAAPLSRVPVSGGEASEVVPEVAGRDWAITQTGVWYLTPSWTGTSELRFLDAATGATRTVLHTDKPVHAGFAISPDQRRVLFSQGGTVAAGSDIMLVENFR
jgi:serine/threonine protein kinase/Tol biopolymer transport system component